MPGITSLDELARLRDELAEKKKSEAGRSFTHITVGMGTCGIAAGALDVLRALEDEIKARQVHDVAVTQVGCIGLCSHEPIVEVTLDGSPKVAYRKVDVELARRIVREHVLGGKVLTDYIVDLTPFPTI